MSDVFAIYDNNISPSLLMIIIKSIILYFIQIRHTDDIPPTGRPLPLLLYLINRTHTRWRARTLIGLHTYTHNSSSILYYKRRSLYLCSAKAPLLPGSVSRRVYRRKGTSLDLCLCVFVACFDRRIFLLFVKNGFGGGGALPR